MLPVRPARPIIEGDVLGAASPLYGARWPSFMSRKEKFPRKFPRRRGGRENDIYLVLTISFYRGGRAGKIRAARVMALRNSAILLIATKSANGAGGHADAISAG